MSDVVFEEDKIQNRSSAYARAYGSITAWCIKKQLAENQAQANVVMLATAFAIVSITAIVASSTFLGNSTVKPASFQEERQQNWIRQGNQGIPPKNFMINPS